MIISTKATKSLFVKSKLIVASSKKKEEKKNRHSRIAKRKYSIVNNCSFLYILWFPRISILSATVQSFRIVYRGTNFPVKILIKKSILKIKIKKTY